MVRDQGAFFEQQVRVRVHLGRFYGLVAEPEGDHGNVHASVQESHGAGMSQHVGGYFLGPK